MRKGCHAQLGKPRCCKPRCCKNQHVNAPAARRPSLRYLKLEAKRRLAAGEFPALHDAQLAIAWEYGQPSWTALKQHIIELPTAECQVLPQLGWVITRFRGADQPGWTAPGPDEMRQHFAPEVLAALPGPELIAAIASAAPALREELTIVAQTPLTAQVRLGGLEVFASAAADPPHRLTGLLAVPLGRHITDPRVAAPGLARMAGDVPAGLGEIAEEGFAELGLPGLALAGGGPGTAAWVVTKGWADLDRGEELRPWHRWPAYCGSALATTTAVLRLVADGRADPRRPRQRPAPYRAARGRHDHGPRPAQPHRRGGQPRPVRAVRRPRSRPGQRHRPGRLLQRPAGHRPAQQRRLRRARPADRRRHGRAVPAGGDGAGAGAARADRLLVPGPPRGPGPGRGDRLQRESGRDVHAGRGGDLHHPGGRRTVGDRRRHGPAGHRVVHAAARPARPGGGHAPDCADAIGTADGPRLAGIRPRRPRRCTPGRPRRAARSCGCASATARSR